MIPDVREQPRAGPAMLPELLSYRAAEIGDRVALTYLDYRARHDGVARTLTWASLDNKVSGVAAWVSAHTRRDDRVAVVAPQGPEWVVAFLGVLRAGRIAVPLHPPRLAGHAVRFAAVLADCAPAVCLTAQDDVGVTTEAAAEVDVAVVVVAVEDLPAAAFAGAPVRPDDVAYLQYSSGSTRSPAGVVLTHRNVVDNANQALRAFGPLLPESTCVSWLPLFHDMGLALAIAVPLASGMRSVLMDPAAFIRQPVRWLLALTTYPSAITAAPDVAYALCASRVTDAERAWLDLAGVQVMINGAEPVAARTIDGFHRAFAGCGLRPATHRVAYGLAEATMLVAMTPAGAAPRRVTVDRDRLGTGVFVPCPGGDRVNTVVSCGVPAGQRLSIVDPRTGEPRPAGHVGEIWVCGPNVGSGYWDAGDEHAATFGNSVTGVPGQWLRTGDLGALHEGELYVVGRLKDVITVDGRSHHPSDIESTVADQPAVRSHRVVAISVPGPDGERVVVLAERSHETGSHDLDEVAEAVRSAIATWHGIAAAEFVLVAPGSLARTSSGNVSRSACRRDYLAGAVKRVSS